jgi:hypothetical protein
MVEKQKIHLAMQIFLILSAGFCARNGIVRAVDWAIRDEVQRGHELVDAEMLSEMLDCHGTVTDPALAIQDIVARDR